MERPFARPLFLRASAHHAFLRELFLAQTAPNWKLPKLNRSHAHSFHALLQHAAPRWTAVDRHGFSARLFGMTFTAALQIRRRCGSFQASSAGSGSSASRRGPAAAMPRAQSAKVLQPQRVLRRDRVLRSNQNEEWVQSCQIKVERYIMLYITLYV